MNVLITGGAGFIGYHLAHNLSLEQNTNVYIIDDLSKRDYTSIGMEMFDALIAKENVYFRHIDLTNTNMLKDMLDDIFYDVVYHLAAINGTYKFYMTPVNIIENNVLSTMSLLKCLHVNNCGRFIFTSSCEAYASTIQNKYDSIPTNEKVSLSIDDVFNPRWSYGGSKILEELYVTNYCNNYNMEFCILRYHNVYGIRDYRHVVPDLIKKMEIFDNVPIEVEICGNNTRSFLYIDDCIEYTKRLAMCKHTFNQIYNVGIQKETSILDLALEMKAILNKDITFKILPAPKGSVTRRCPDMKKTIEATNYYPKTTLTNGLKIMIDYYQKHKCII